MKYRIVFYIAIALVMLGLLIARSVPGATEANGDFTTAYWLNSYFVVMGFVVTTAVVSPVVGLFLDWRSNRAWRAARLNLLHRFASVLKKLLDSYGQFLREETTGDEHHQSARHLVVAQRALDDFFDAYESEQSAFNAEMHSAASNLRQRLLPLKRSVETVKAMVNRRRSHRLYIGKATLDDLRAVFEQPALAPDSKLAANKYFANHGELFCDVRLDLQLGAGWTTFEPFAGINWASLETEWTKLVGACPSGLLSATASKRQIKELTQELQLKELTQELQLKELTNDEDAQARLQARYAEEHIEDKSLAAALIVKPRLAGASQPTSPPGLLDVPKKDS